MRFIEFHGWGESSITFLLDYAVSIKPAENERHTMVSLITGEQLVLEISYEEFIAKTFSDMHDENEYQLITIEYTDPQPS